MSTISRTKKSLGPICGKIFEREKKSLDIAIANVFADIAPIEVHIDMMAIPSGKGFHTFELVTTITSSSFSKPVKATLCYWSLHETYVTLKRMIYDEINRTPAPPA